MRRNSVQLQRDWEYFNAVALSRSMLRSRMNSAMQQLAYAHMMKDDASIARIHQEIEEHKKCLRMIFATRPK
jgi:hypothetical protein